MGGAVGHYGITIQFYDKSGRFTTGRPIYQPCCWLTGQQATPGVGSKDWLKEVYLAPDQESLYSLMRAYHPSGTVPLTSAASQDVLVSYIDSDGSAKSKTWKTAIGIGSDIKVMVGGSSESLRLIDTLLLCDGDAHADDTNGLHKIFEDSSIALN